MAKQYHSASKLEKGAVAGGIWGTSEMTLGSLLHNLRITFKGYMLTFIAVALLSGINIRWRQRGLFYRAGLTSALLKFFSPSHNLLVPAIAISIEGFLMEAGSLLLGYNRQGFALGGALALSWTLIHKLIRLFITFGPNIYLIYEKVFFKAAESLGLSGLTPAIGIASVFLLYIFLGALASLIGSSIGSGLKDETVTIINIKSVPVADKTKAPEIKTDFRPSLAWLFVSSVVFITAVGFMHSHQWLIPFLAIYFIFAAIRYSSTIKKFLQPKFYIPVIAVSFLSGLFIYSGESGLLSVNAAAGGLAMVFRACLMTIVINSVTNEIQHPLIADKIKRKYGEQMNGTMKTAWDTNRTVSSVIRGSDFRKKPLQAFRNLLLAADMMLDDIKATVVVVTGKIDAGKTAFMSTEAERLKNQVRICGFLSIAKQYIGTKDLYYLTDITDGEEMPLCRKKPDAGCEFFEESIEFFDEKTRNAAKNADYVFIDEAGRLELKGGGWDALITELLLTRKTLVIAVRDDFVQQFLEKYGIRMAYFINVSEI